MRALCLVVLIACTATVDSYETCELTYDYVPEACTVATLTRIQQCNGDLRRCERTCEEERNERDVACRRDNECLEDSQDLGRLCSARCDSANETCTAEVLATNPECVDCFSLAYSRCIEENACPTELQELHCCFESCNTGGPCACDGVIERYQICSTPFEATCDEFAASECVPGL